MNPRFLQIKKDILNDNDRSAQELREIFQENGIFVLNIVSSPGSGKTELITKLAKKLLSNDVSVSVIVGDLETDNDAKRIRTSKADAFQINTHGNCHLEAAMIKSALLKLKQKQPNILIIENVGNLVCPSGFDLGENVRIVLLAVTEGEDKPVKYNTMFMSSDICIITKTDMVEAAGFDKSLAIRNIKKINPSIRIFECSAKHGYGIDEIATFLIEKSRTKT